MGLIKKMDIVIIALLILLSFTPHLIFAKSSLKNSSSTYASIKVDGEHYKDIALSETEEIKIDLNNKENTILIKNKTIEMKSANCKDELCVKQGSISKVGQTIICLPHKLIIEIKGEETDSKDDLILSH